MTTQNPTLDVRKFRDRVREVIVEEYLALREPAYIAEIRRRGLPVRDLRQPRPSFPGYDSSNPKHRQDFAMSMRRRAQDELETARELYSRERDLGLVPRTPPWAGIDEEGFPDKILLDLFNADQRGYLDEVRWSCKSEIEEEYSIPGVVLLERDEPVRSCLGPNCRNSPQQSDVLCADCRRWALTPAQCPNCGDGLSALFLKFQQECARCSLVTPEERAALTNAPVAAWAQFRVETGASPGARPMVKVGRSKKT